MEDGRKRLCAILDLRFSILHLRISLALLARSSREMIEECGAALRRTSALPAPWRVRRNR
jgi:hypothetical protein